MEPWHLQEDWLSKKESSRYVHTEIILVFIERKTELRIQIISDITDGVAYRLYGCTVVTTFQLKRIAEFIRYLVENGVDLTNVKVNVSTKSHITSICMPQDCPLVRAITWDSKLRRHVTTMVSFKNAQLTNGFSTFSTTSHVLMLRHHIDHSTLFLWSCWTLNEKSTSGIVTLSQMHRLFVDCWTFMRSFPKTMSRKQAESCETHIWTKFLEFVGI